MSGIGVETKEIEKHERIFQEIVVEYLSYNSKEKPYFAIKYMENGQEFIGFGTYKPEVLSEYLKEYFMPYAEPRGRRMKMTEKTEKTVCDPVELVKDLADKIGIDQLYAIACDIRGKGGKDVENHILELEMQNKELKARIDYMKEDKAMMQGEINGLRFAIRCNGVSGNEVQ